MDPIPNTQPMSETQPVTPTQKSSKTYIVLGIVVLLLIVGGGIAWMYNSANKKAANNAVQPYMPYIIPASPTASVSSDSEEQQVESVTISDPENDVKDIEIDVSSL